MSTSAAKLATEIPLVTVVPVGLLVLEAGFLRVSTTVSKNSKTRQVEDDCGVVPGRYFYAGRAHPQFGDLGLVYSPAAEVNHTGAANPFDTGGAYHGYMEPFTSMLTNEGDLHSRACALIRATNSDLATWRTVLASFLDALFEAPTDYLELRPPKPAGTWGPADLPAENPSNYSPPNQRWRAWTWEVRFHEPHAVEQSLVGWTATPAAYQTLVDARINDPSPLTGSRHPLDLLLSRPPISVEIGFTEALNRFVSPGL